jgi:hypothetical protein
LGEVLEPYQVTNFDLTWCRIFIQIFFCICPCNSVMFWPWCIFFQKLKSLCRRCFPIVVFCMSRFRKDGNWVLTRNNSSNSVVAIVE